MVDGIGADRGVATVLSLFLPSLPRCTLSLSLFDWSHPRSRASDAWSVWFCEAVDYITAQAYSNVVGSGNHSYLRLYNKEPTVYGCTG